MFKIFKLTVAVLALSLIMGCSNDSNPVKDDDTDHDHAEAVGCVISSSGVELARYEEGAVTGSLNVKVGETTPLLSISFIAEDGDIFQPEDDAYSLAWEVADADLAKIIQHDEDGKWLFHLSGIATGNTEITFKVLHGDHADFVAKPIPVQVTE